MCGVVATIRWSDTTPHNNRRTCPQLGVRIERLKHRGPDSRGTATVPLLWGAVDLGMSRLKIVDQSDLEVPYRFEGPGVTLAFNGEIYNWRELKRALWAEYQEDIFWETQCDAEVLAWAWRAWGQEMLPRLNGMWSFVLVDTVDDVVYAARDRAGQKPLYWMRWDDGLHFASEPKALPGPLEECASFDCEVFEFDYGVETPLRCVNGMEAGSHWLIHEHTFGGTGSGELEHWNSTPRLWWLPPVVLRNHLRDDALYRETVRELTDLIVDSVRVRLSSEVDVALQLSGGLDSAIIFKAWQSIDAAGAAAATKVCMDFAVEGIDNLSRAQLVTDDVLPVGLTVTEVERLLPVVLYHLDTPATWSALCLWKLAEAIHASGARIILSGEGADELFAGYTRYRILWWLDALRQDELLSDYWPTIYNAVGTADSALCRMLNRSRPPELGAEHVRHIVDLYTEGSDGGSVRRAMAVEFSTTMQVLLRMGDRMASAWGLENRCPFLDHRIISLASTMPEGWLIGRGGSKVILRDVARELGVPEAIVQEKTKRGLAIPWGRWAAVLTDPLEYEGCGARGSWDRGGFADLSLRVWRQTVPRVALCASDCDLCRTSVD